MKPHLIEPYGGNLVDLLVPEEDLVLIDGDPLADIRNTRRISAVVSNGRYLDRAALDALLANAERLARSGKHDMIHRPTPGRALR